MPYENVWVFCRDKSIVKEGGYEEFPHHISRWSKAEKESRGRGVGVFVLPQVRALNQMKHDLIECGNRHNNPASEVGPGLEGPLDLSPRGVNYVTSMGSIRSLETTAGNLPTTAEILQMERQEIHRAFLIDVFNQLMNLQGDRRTTLEINERLREGLRRLAQPVGRLIAEQLDSLITRSYLLLVRHGVIPPPPLSLQGRGLKVHYTSFLVLMLKQYQAQAFMRWVGFVAEMENVFPGAKDNVDADTAIRDMADSFGVKVDHIRSIRTRDAIRQRRAQELAKQQAAQAAQLAADSYKKTTRAPEEGSMAGAMIGG
jgi:hypothetical protein